MTLISSASPNHAGMVHCRIYWLECKIRQTRHDHQHLSMPLDELKRHASVCSSCSYTRADSNAHIQKKISSLLDAALKKAIGAQLCRTQAFLIVHTVPGAYVSQHCPLMDCLLMDCPSLTLSIIAATPTPGAFVADCID